jgi:hypothetical protein
MTQNAQDIKIGLDKKQQDIKEYIFHAIIKNQVTLLLFLIVFGTQRKPFLEYVG